MPIFHGINSCCTALHMNGVDGLDSYGPKGLLNWVEESLLSGIKQAIGGASNWERVLNGYALILAISVEDQKCEETLKKLGFENSFVAEKTHLHSRETDSGALTVWCVQPWVFIEKRKALIKELKGQNKPSAEELKRRQGFEEFRLKQYQDNEVVLSYTPEGQKGLYRRDLLPTSFGDRNRIFALVQSLTGGYQPGQDPEIVSLVAQRKLTWGELKDRAVMWRNGDFL